MLFNSFPFAVFMPLVFAIYWLLAKNVRLQNLFLLAASYFFYAWWDWRYLSLILVCSLTNYSAGLLMMRCDNASRGATNRAPTKRKIVLIACCLVCFGVLGVFKYYDFFVSSFVDAVRIFGLTLNVKLLHLILPVGISFYTFHTLSYTIDVYRRKFEPTRDLSSFFLFVSIFPLAMAGPIERATNLLPQIYKKRVFDYTQAVEGLQQILWGLFMKVVIADRVSLYVDRVYTHTEAFNGLGLFIASLLFAVQIYCDFAGYSNMAIGIGKTLGFNFLHNFNRPYFSTSITDFWRRWHISLSSWLKDYIYIPLGGSRCSKWRNYWNIFVTFLVSGIWHGANWTFVVWGALHGIFQIFEKMTGLDKKQFHGVRKCMQILITFLIVNFLWIFFRMPTLHEAVSVIAKIFTDFWSQGLYIVPNNLTKTNTVSILFCVFMLLSKEFFDEFLPKKMQLFNNRKTAVRWVAYLAVFLIIMLLGVFDGGQFIYFQF